MEDIKFAEEAVRRLQGQNDRLAAELYSREKLIAFVAKRLGLEASEILRATPDEAIARLTDGFNVTLAQSQKPVAS